MVTDTSAFKSLYPFESHFIELGANRYHYVDEGEGETLLMLHGNPTWSFYYRNLIAAFKGKYRCIAPDHMGCGLSDKPPQYDYTLERHIDNLEALVDQLQLKRLTLLVHDWGGAIGMGLAVRRPELISRLIFFNTAAFLSDRIPFSINLCRVPILGAALIRGLNAFARAALIRAAKHKDRLTAEVRAGYLTPYDSFANRIATLRFVQDIPMSADIPSYPIVKNIEENLGRFNATPKMIIWGRKDFCFTFNFLNRWKEIYPDALVHEAVDAGHYVVEDAYERIIPWVEEFLEKNAI